MSKKQVFFSLPVLGVLLAISIFSCVKDEGRLAKPVNPATAQTLCDSLNVKYSTVIQPMMVSNCATIGCHDGFGGSGPGDLNTYATLQAMYINGTLNNRVIVLKDMPSTGPLPDSLIQRLQCWMDAGAPNN
jgi:hypothetical protein